MVDTYLGYLLLQAAKPGRGGVEAAHTLLQVVQPLRHGEMLAALWAHRPARLPWAYALTTAWRASSRGVYRAMREPARAVAWFRYADCGASLPPFFNGMWRTRAEMPSRLALWRGGNAAPGVLASGLSWTPSRAMACWYALRWAGRYGGDPVVLGCRVPRSSVLWAWKATDRETLIERPRSWRVVAADRTALRAAAEPAEATWQAAVAEARRHLASPQGDPWAGWEAWEAGEVLPRP